ncbi:hypothetical protein PJO48_29745, partial [Mycobacterium kansasii]
MEDLFGSAGEIERRKEEGEFWGRIQRLEADSRNVQGLFWLRSCYLDVGRISDWRREQRLFCLKVGRSKEERGRKKK